MVLIKTAILILARLLHFRRHRIKMALPTMSDFIFNTTRTIIHELGAARRLAQICLEQNARRVLLVTDGGIVDAGLLKGLLPGFTEKQMEVRAYQDVEPDPSDSTSCGGSRFGYGRGVNRGCRRRQFYGRGQVGRGVGSS